MKTRIREQFGATIFETAVILLVSLTMLIGAVGVSDVVMTSYRVSRATDLIAYDQILKPLAMREDGSIVLNETGLRDNLRNLADQSEAVLEGLISGPSSDYRVELEVAVVEIDTRTGRINRISSRPSLRQNRGSFSVPSTIREQTRFEPEYERVIGREGELTPYAISLPQVPGSSDQFLPMAAVLGVRVFVSLADSPTAVALQRLGFINNDLVFDWKVIPLRGDVEAVR